MTLCIAAECWNGKTQVIAMCCDTRAERGGTFQELVGSEDVDKIREIGPVSALLSGSETDADELLTLCEKSIRQFAATPATDESDVAITEFLKNLREQAAIRKKDIADHYLRMNFGMSHQEFLDQHRDKLHESYSREIWSHLVNVNLETDIVLCGFSGDEAVIVRLDRWGKTHWETNYSVVGVGSDIALAFLCQREWENEREPQPDNGIPLTDCLYRLYEAKRAAQANRHVGDATSFQVLLPDGRRCDISDECFERFKKTYEDRLKLEPFVFLEEILKDTDDTKDKPDSEGPKPTFLPTPNQ